MVFKETVSIRITFDTGCKLPCVPYIEITKKFVFPTSIENRYYRRLVYSKSVPSQTYSTNIIYSIYSISTPTSYILILIPKL